MQMILNPDTKKYIPKIFAAVLIATTLLIAMNVRYYQKYADFMPVDAMITDVQRHITSSPSSDNKTSYTTHVNYQYNYGSHNASKTYTTTRTDCSAQINLAGSQKRTG